MEPPPTYKKATAALDEAARARLRGPFASDTMPSEREDVDDGLVDLVDEFYNGYGEDDAVAKEAVAPRPAEWNDALHAALAEATADAVAAQICAEAELAVVVAGPGIVGGEAIRKRVVERLRARGFDAGLCKSSWERNGNVPAGSHEYVDVVVATSWSTSRYIVEANFSSEFEIARPSNEYQGLLHSLPQMLVAKPEIFKEVAAAMCAGAAESIRGAGMHVPPWRRARYVQGKWSGQYKRVPAVAARITAAPEVAGNKTPAARWTGVPSGGRKQCGIEIARRESALGMDRLPSVRPLFRGL